jgi:hypothetical protein
LYFTGRTEAEGAGDRWTEEVAVVVAAGADAEDVPSSIVGENFGLVVVVVGKEFFWARS